MSITPIQFVLSHNVPTAQTKVATVSAVKALSLCQALVCNTASSAIVFSLYYTPSGGTALLIYTSSIAASSSTTPSGLAKMVLNPGDALSVQASAAGLNLIVSALEIA